MKKRIAGIILFVAFFSGIGILVAIGMRTSTVYYSYGDFLRTGKMVCVAVETWRGEQPCSVLEEKKTATYESRWAK